MRGRLLAQCPDRPGVVAAVAGFLAEREPNITDLDQHARGDGELLMRLVFEGETDLAALTEEFDRELAAGLRMRARFRDAAHRRQVMLAVSREPHCVLDQLWRFASGELPGDVAGVMSNHPDLAEQVESLGVRFHLVPNPREGQREAEAEMAALIEAAGTELLVLARYMRILSPEFLERLQCPAINIHHSFLPAFIGADPYAQAHARGVKVIGATAHYVTAELDEGPIIAQDTRPISHRDEVPDLVRIGRDLERVVLADAVRAELGDRVILDGERTVVF